MLESFANRKGAARDERTAHGAGYSMLALGDFRPQWHHLTAGILRWTGALRLGEGLARGYSIPTSCAGRLPRLHNAAGPRILILCYHRIGIGGIPFYSELPTRLFEAQIRFLRRHYRILSLADAYSELGSPASTEPAVVITFDDGYRDLYTQALPILQRYQIPAMIYLTVGTIETGRVAWYDRIFLVLKHIPGPTLECDLGEAQPRRLNLANAAGRFRAAIEIITSLRRLPDAHRRELCVDLEKRVRVPAAELVDRMLTWEQIRSMRIAGVFFGCHTMTHPVVSRLTASDLERELVQSKELMEERIGAPVFDFAYPFGKRADCGTEARALLKRAGYRTAVTTTSGVNVRGVDRYELLRSNSGDERSLAMFAVQLNWQFLRASSDPERSGSQDVPSVHAQTARNAQKVIR